MKQKGQRKLEVTEMMGLTLKSRSDGTIFEVVNFDEDDDEVLLKNDKTGRKHWVSRRNLRPNYNVPGGMTKPRSELTPIDADKMRHVWLRGPGKKWQNPKEVHIAKYYAHGEAPSAEKRVEAIKRAGGKIGMYFHAEIDEGDTPPEKGEIGRSTRRMQALQKAGYKHFYIAKNEWMEQAPFAYVASKKPLNIAGMKEMTEDEVKWNSYGFLHQTG